MPTCTTAPVQTATSTDQIRISSSLLLKLAIQLCLTVHEEARDNLKKKIEICYWKQPLSGQWFVIPKL